jgi:YidC/Oxa1 family membrane protein insertase
MDKKTIIGLVLMVAVFIGYTFYMSSEQEKAAEIKEANEKAAKELREIEAAKAEKLENLSPEDRKQQELTAQVIKHGQTLLERHEMESQIDTVRNGYMTVCFDRVGGKIVSVELNDYKRYEKGVAKEERANVNLINPGSAYFGIDIHRGDVTLNTNDYLFDCDVITAEDNSATKVVMTLPLDEQGGEVKDEVKYTYTINNSGNPSEDYLIDFDFAQKGLSDYLEDSSEIILRWKHESMHNEKSFTNESAASTIMFYDHEEEESDEIEASG